MIDPLDLPPRRPFLAAMEQERQLQGALDRGLHYFDSRNGDALDHVRVLQTFATEVLTSCRSSSALAASSTSMGPLTSMKQPPQMISRSGISRSLRWPEGATITRTPHRPQQREKI